MEICDNISLRKPIGPPLLTQSGKTRLAAAMLRRGIRRGASDVTGRTYSAKVGKNMIKIPTKGFLYGVVLLTLFSANTYANEAENGKIINVGFVLYTKSPAPGTLNARWLYSTQYRGPGIATGGPAEGFAGDYHVRYFFEDGAFSDEYDLHIKKVGAIYEVNWLVEGEVEATGVGMETDEGLAVGWRRVAD